MTDYWLIRAGKNGELWDSWIEEGGIITIGWDVGDISESEPSWDEMRDEIVSEHSPDDPSQCTGRVRRFVGIRNDPSDNIKEGDYVVVEGNATVTGVAKVGEYRYETEGLSEAPSHTYWREVDYIHKGRVRIRDLPPRFQQGGDDSLHLVPTIQRYKSADESVIDDLLSALEDAETVENDDMGIFRDFNEASLQSYLEYNLEGLFPHVDGFSREYSNTSGNADFVCEMEDGRTVVIETKIGTAGHDAVSQLMSYMNAIREERTEPVSGALVAEDFSTKAEMASRSDEIELYQFETKLTFDRVD